MADGIIQRKELITDDAFNWPKEYKKDLEELIAISKKLGTTSTKLPGSDPKTKKSLDELQRVQNNLAKATERSSKEFLDQKAALDKLNRENREAVKTINAQTDAYDKLDRELNTTRKAYKNLAAAGKENTAEAKKLLAQTKKLDTQLKKIDNTVGQNQRSVGKYSNALKGVTAHFLGWAAVSTVLFKALKSGIQIVLNYSKANSTLNAILNKTKEETKELRKQQQELGRATAFSATQVTKAQTELARLGLTIAEITDLTPAILDAAVAFGVDMAQAAELVAGQLNAFNLAASEGQRVADVLTKATQISAFTYQKLFDALRVVSPAAEAVGVSIEKTIGILTAAVDANIEASTASTALRNIFIELEGQGLTWDEAMTKINASTNRLSTANELFGKRGAVVATVIANNTDKINTNTKALENSAGAAKTFADEQLDNLRGDMTLLTSVWEGFILSIETGDGALARFVRGALQAFTRILGELTPALESQAEAVERQKIELTALITAIQKTNKNEDLRERLIRKLNKNYPKFLENINDESVSNETLFKRLKEVNEELERKFLMQLKEEELQGLFIQLTKARLSERDATIDLAKANVNNFNAVEDLKTAQLRLNEAYKTNDADIIENAKLLNNSLLIIKISQVEQATLRAEIEKTTSVYDELAGSIEGVDRVTKTLTDDIADGVKELQKLESLVAELPEKLTKFQKELLSLTDALFGKNTIDEDAAEFLSKTDKAIRDVAQKAKEQRRKDAKDDQLLADTKAAIVDKSFDLAAETANRFTDLRLMQINQEIDALEFAHNRELEGAEGNARAQFEINKRFDEERKKLQRKQVITEKANALFSIALNIAIGVTNALSKVVTAPLVPFIIAAGAVQAAAVLAAPIPKFDKGSERTPKDYIAGEKRPELRKSKGKWNLIKESTMFKNSPGDKIISGKETDSILGTMSDLTGKNVLSNPALMLGLLNNDFEKKKAGTDLAYIIKKTSADMVQAINNKKLLDIRVNTARAYVTERGGQTRIDHINTQYRS